MTVFTEVVEGQDIHLCFPLHPCTELIKAPSDSNKTRIPFIQRNAPNKWKGGFAIRLNGMELYAL
jgi:hypothetical protein